MGHFLKIRLIQIADPGFETPGELLHGIHGWRQLMISDPIYSRFRYTCHDFHLSYGKVVFIHVKIQQNFHFFIVTQGKSFSAGNICYYD